MLDHVFFFILPAPHKFEVQSLTMDKEGALIGRHAGSRVCHSPQVLKSDKLLSLCRGHVRWRALAQDAGPCAALAFRQRRLHLVGGALRCPQLAHYRKELNPSVMPLVVLVSEVVHTLAQRRRECQCCDCRTRSSSTSRYESISKAPRTARRWRNQGWARYCIAEATCCAPGFAALGQRHWSRYFTAHDLVWYDCGRSHVRTALRWGVS